ncbi:MAG TPA: hypothetical protein VHV32_19195 [Candidatus Angelobacter sp.]|jgi:hypothetical protein|nr:hypothetical protein [Candidatus Angelobacter sp.]
MKPLFDPSLISLDNAMEDFMLETRRNNERNFSDTEAGELWADAHMRFHFPKQFPAKETDSEADRKFIESAEKIIAANRPKQQRFSWAGVIALLAVAAVVMLLTYWAVEGF